MRKNLFLILILLFGYPLKNSLANSGVAVIRALNKVTATSSVLEVKIGEKVNFGRAIILAHKCWEAPLEQKPESKILLEIFERGNIDNSEDQSGEIKKSEEKRIFYGWMFASSPSISSLEHPIYDFTALGCK
jgi:hypothetical protein